MHHCYFRDKDEEVSLTQKLEEIKTNFNSLRRYYTACVTCTQQLTKLRGCSTFLNVPFKDDQGGQKGERHR